MLTECPIDPALSEFAAGELLRDELTRVSEHVNACPRCAARVQAFQCAAPPTEVLLGDLRKAVVPEAPSDPEFQAAVRNLLAVPKGRALQIGNVIDDYRLVEVLGEGGMGVVYRAVHTRLESEFALKVIRRTRSVHPQAADRFRREMRAAGKLKHDNLVRATNAGVADGLAYLVMEFVPGTNLARLVNRDGPVPLARACELVRQAAFGLHHAHQHGLVHRDVKPSNLLLGTDGIVRVLDLGLALLPDELPELAPDVSEAPTTTAPDDTLTSPGQQLGTRNYTAPEQLADSHRVDHRVDIYGLGCTLSYLLTGQPPADGKPYPTQLPRELWEKFLAVQPADRFASMLDAAEALAPYCSDTPAAADPPEPPRRARRGWFVPAVLAALLIGGIVAVLLVNKPAPTPEPEGEIGKQVQPVESKVLAEAPFPHGVPPRGSLPMTGDAAQGLQKQWADHIRQPVSVKNPLGLMLVPPGEFMLSSQCRVRIVRPYYLGACEVTVAQFRRFVEAEKYQTSAVSTGKGGTILKPDFKPVGGEKRILSDPRLNWENPGHETFDPDQPVCMVSWEDAIAYCHWLSKLHGQTYRLPTEAELTWAMRCGNPSDEYIPPGGPLALRIGWHRFNCDQPQPVGKLEANAWGLFDTYGNVAEFCADRAAPLPVGTFDDFTGATDPARSRRVFLGYSHLTPGFKPQPLRDSALPDQSWGHVGFRIARDVP